MPTFKYSKPTDIRTQIHNSSVLFKLTKILAFEPLDNDRDQEANHKNDIIMYILVSKDVNPATLVAKS